MKLLPDGQIGERGIRHEDDVSHAIFTVSHPDTAITVDDLKGQFGVRLTSVQDNSGGREWSSKINGDPVCASNNAASIVNPYPCTSQYPIPHVPSDSTSSTVPATSTTSSTLSEEYCETIVADAATCQQNHPSLFG